MVYLSIIVGILIIYYLYNKFIRWSPVIPSILEKSNLFIYGHRGVPSYAPENTLYSFQKAFDMNVDGIELDVQITKDNILVVHHDTHLEKLTGEQTLISTLNYHDLLKIDARGSEFDSIEFQKIPKLDDVLEILPKNIVINIEIKSQKLFSEGMEKLVLNSILKYNLLDKAIVSSFNPLLLRKIKCLNSKIITAQLWDEEEEFSSLWWVYVSRPDLFHGNIDQFNKKIISRLKAMKLQIYAYTVNSSEQLAKVKHLNLDGIFTDDPTICK
jgi:glycerophosphoryl diester phosphodiesterase